MKLIKKIGTWVGGVLFSICFLVVLLVTSFEVGAYGNWGFYEKEYKKYNVTEDLKMEMPDVMDVTKNMMAFLRGNREDLIVPTVVDGQQRNFFNADEISHMDDVKEMFVWGLRLRIVAVVLMVLLIALWIWKRVSVKRILPLAFQYTTLALGTVTAVIAGLFISNFDKYFVIFHELFFSQGNWTFDPAVSLMINMLPEGFFSDIAGRIVLIFMVLLLASFIVATGARMLNGKEKPKNK
ncbi:MAG: TIGR01906 family membrane protein [Lachnospiraceae bacterium]